MSHTALFEIKVHKCTPSNLPLGDDYSGRRGFIHDGAIYTGWPIVEDGCIPIDMDELHWEASEDCVRGKFVNVKYWVEFPIPIREMGGNTMYGK